MSSRAVLDTDTISSLMRGEPLATRNAEAYLSDVGPLTISAVTRYEVLRGLEAKRATRQMTDFNRFCETLDVLAVTDAVIVRAAAAYGDLHRRGQLIGDADILIAATCLEHAREIVTNNTAHFMRFEGLTVRNWIRGDLGSRP